MAIMGLLPRSARVTGSIKFRGEELVGRKSKDMQAFRGSKIAMIFQDPMTSLNPVYTVGWQLSEAVPRPQRRVEEGGVGARRAHARPRRHPEGARTGRAPIRTSSPAACASGR